MLGACMLILVAQPANARPDEKQRQDFFEAKIRPILINTCMPCHGEKKSSSGLRVDTRESLLKGGETGPAVEPGKAHQSLLIQAIQRGKDVAAMPPDKEKALRPDQVADFVAWVKQGATWPQGTSKLEAARHWAFEPVRDVPLPEIHDKSWPKTSVDAFVLARQEAAGVRSAKPADKLALIRRATFDLTGLPPTPAEIEAFAQDPSPNAFDTVIDRLLASPSYGERWGQHWLDVVRYADTAGETADYPVPLAWRYRNYVVDAFNADKPYDEFLREQVAGDILANDAPSQRYAELASATGYLAISRRFGFDSENYHHLTIQDTIDTLGQSVLGLSLGCARCHDHKFDPVSARDYYALYGIFESSRYAFPGSEQKQRVRTMLPLLPPSESLPKWREHGARVAALKTFLTKQNQAAPAAVLRSLHDLDGDFELQAPAAGGSNGVLVQPWLYQGQIAVTNAAQSPFKNLFDGGKVGASVPSQNKDYAITQAIHPSRTSDNSDIVHVNLDFRIPTAVPDSKRLHVFTLGASGAPPAVALRISSQAIALQADQEPVALKPNVWYNVQLSVDMKKRLVSGRLSDENGVTPLPERSFPETAPNRIDVLEFRSAGSNDSALPAIEFDNLGLQDTPISPATTKSSIVVSTTSGIDPIALSARLEELVGFDGDLELQANGAPPSKPWNAGPNSVVKLASDSQSPFRNIFPLGEIGVSMPNRAEYDGFGHAFAAIKPKGDRVFAGFDFRCRSNAAGGDGTWRYYLGHGAGNSAAVELFFNGDRLFRKSGGAIEPVGPLVVSEWYQVQLSLDLNKKTYEGTVSSRLGKLEFQGALAAGWDGTIDHTFIDSYGQIPGVRPSLDADNFVIDDKPLPPFDTKPSQDSETSSKARRNEVAEIRKQFAAIQSRVDDLKRELETSLIKGPFPMTYGVVEGTPHNARLQLRGEPDQFADEIPRGFIKVLGGKPLPPDARGSGRLELAEWLANPSNPLTARVMVNRIWQYHFGRGLVKTPNDFGVRGLPPTDPDLLDHLATAFIRSDWSVKAMHRLIMRSATYQEASVPPDSSSSVDTTDLYVSFPRRRLSAEEIRDAILAVTGELDRTVPTEHPFPSPITWGFTQHGPFAAVYDHNQRSIYLMRQRLKRHPYLALFDGADPNTTTPDRLTTTVPTQALFFLNDPFVHAKAETWAARLLNEEPDEAKRLERAWRQALGRAPTDDERAEASEFLREYRAELEMLKLDKVPMRSLAAYLRALIGGNEFLHVD